MIDYSDPQLLWWEETDKDKAAGLMLGLVDMLYQANEPRRAQNLRHAKLAANQDLSSIYDSGPSTVGAGAGIYLSVNVTESCMNTLAAKMTRTRIRPYLKTERGSRSQQRAAEDGTDFIDGVYHASELHEAEGEQIFTDGGLFGCGWSITQPNEDDEIVVDRVLDDEILYDEQEAINGMRALWTIYRRKYIHRQTLYRMADENGKAFGDNPAKRAAIKAAGAFRRPGMSYADDLGQMIPVTFAWHLPSKKDANDGRYLVAIGSDIPGRGTALFGKPWKRRKFPINMFQFQRKPTGIRGRSLAEQLVPIQLKINEQIESIDEGQRLNSGMRIVYQAGAIDPDTFDNEIGRLVELAVGHTVGEVQVLEGKGASAEMYNDLETWIRRAYEVTGISMLSATAEKPDGISSAVALRELLDREDLRFSALGKRWERFHRDVGETILDTAAEMVEEGKKLVVQVPGDKFVRRIDFKGLKIDRERSIVDVGAASALPTTPAAKKQYADELLDRGAITMARYLQIIDEAGDVRGVTSMVTAVQESIDLDIEDILEKAKWRAPEKLRDPALARDTALAEYAKATHENVPEKNMEMLRKYILLATKMAGPSGATGGAVEQAQAAQQALQQTNPAAVAASVPAPPGAPPTADLQAAAPPAAPPVVPVQ